MEGGFNIKPIKESNFKYTKNRSRKEWVKNIYPFGEHIIPLFLNIPFKSYKYEGEFRGWYMNEDDKFEYKDLKISAKYSSQPYFYFFGGTSYELLNATYKSVDLHKYVDPTGDIDISLLLPHIEIDSENEYLNYLFTDEKKSEDSISPLLDDYTKWVFNQVANQFEKLPKKLFDNIFGECENLELKEKRDFIHLIHKKIAIIRHFEIDDSMIKIQGVCKFKKSISDHLKMKSLNTQIHNSYVDDHFFELILPLYDLDDSEFINSKHKTMKLKDTIYISDLNSLFIGDMLAIQTRIHAFDTNLNENQTNMEHKFYNHIGRFQYLIKFITNSILKENKLELSNKEITNLISFSLKIFTLFYLLKLSNKLKLIDYTSSFSDKEIIENSLRTYYTILKERYSKDLKEEQAALSLENKTFKKSQIDGLDVNYKKKTDSKEPTITYKLIYKELFPTDGGRKKNQTRKKLK
jgi:hypothetical protein